MAPEQLEGKDADARTDIFACGVTLYEKLTGRKAFEGKSQTSLISAIMTAEPQPVRSKNSIVRDPRGRRPAWLISYFVVHKRIIAEID